MYNQNNITQQTDDIDTSNKNMKTKINANENDFRTTKRVPLKSPTLSSSYRKMDLNIDGEMAMEDTFALTDFSSPIAKVNSRDGMSPASDEMQSKEANTDVHNPLSTTAAQAINQPFHDSFVASTKVPVFSSSNETHEEETNITKSVHIQNHTINFPSNPPTLHINASEISQMQVSQSHVSSKQNPPAFSSISNLSTPSFFQSNQSRLNRSQTLPLIKPTLTQNTSAMNSTTASILDQWRTERLRDNVSNEKKNNTDTDSILPKLNDTTVSPSKLDEIQIGKFSISPMSNALSAIESGNVRHSFFQSKTAENMNQKFPHSQSILQDPGIFRITPQNDIDNASFPNSSQVTIDSNNKSLNAQAMQKQLMALIQSLQISLQKSSSKINMQETDINKYEIDLERFQNELSQEKSQKKHLSEFMESMLKDIQSKTLEIDEFCTENNIDCKNLIFAKEENENISILVKKSMENLLQQGLSNLYQCITKCIAATKKSSERSHIMSQKAEQAMVKLQSNSENSKAIQKQIHNLRKEEYLLSDKVKKLRSEKLQLDMDCETSQQNLEGLNTNLNVKEERLKFLDQKQNDQESQIKTHRQTLQSLHEEHKKMQDLIRKGRNELGSLKESLIEKSDEVNKCKITCKKIMKEADEKKYRAESAQNEAVRMKKEIVLLKKQAADQMAEVHGLKSKCQEEYIQMLNMADETKKNADMKMKDAEVMYASAQEISDSANADVEKVEAKKKELAHKEKMLAQETKDMDLRKQEIESNFILLSKSRMQLKKESGALANRRSTIEKEEEVIKSVQEQLLEMQNSQMQVENSQQIQHQNIEKQQREISVNQKFLKEEKVSLDDFRKEMEDLQTEIHERELHFDEISMSFQMQKKDLEQREQVLTKLKKEVLQKEKELGDHINQFDIKERSLEERTRMIVVGEDELSLLKDSVLEREKKLKHDEQLLNDSNEAVEQDRIELERARKTVKDEKRSLERSRTSFKADLETFERTQKKHIESNTEEIKRLSDLKELLSQQEDTLRKSFADIKSREGIVLDKENKIAAKVQELLSRESEISQSESHMESQKDDFSVKVGVLNAALSDSEIKLKKEKTETQKMKKKRVAMESQFQKMQDEAKLIRTNAEQKIELAMNELIGLKEQIDQNQSLLKSIKNRVVQAKEEEKIVMADKETSLRNLKSKLNELKNDKDFFEEQIQALRVAIEDDTHKHEKVIQQVQNEREKFHNHKMERVQEMQTIIESKKHNFNEHFTRVKNNTKIEIEDLAMSFLKTFDTSSAELHRKADKLIQLKFDIEKTAEKLSEDRKILSKNKTDYDLERKKLDMLLQRVSKSSSQEAAQIKKLEYDLTAVKDAQEVEKKEHSRLMFIESKKNRERMTQLKFQLEEDNRKSNLETRSKLMKEIHSLQKDKEVLSNALEMQKESLMKKIEILSYDKQNLEDSLCSYNIKLADAQRIADNSRENLAKLQEELANEIDQQQKIEKKSKDVFSAAEKEQQDKLNDMIRGVKEQSAALIVKEEEYNSKKQALMNDQQSLKEQFANINESIFSQKKLESQINEEKSMLALSREALIKREEELVLQTKKLMQKNRHFALKKIIAKHHLISQRNSHEIKLKSIEKSHARFTEENDKVWRMREDMQQKKDEQLHGKESEIKIAQEALKTTVIETEILQKELDSRKKLLSMREKDLCEMGNEHKKKEQQLLDKVKEMDDSQEKLQRQILQLKEEQSQRLNEYASKNQALDALREKIEQERIALDKKTLDTEERSKVLDEKELMLEKMGNELEKARLKIKSNEEFLASKVELLAHGSASKNKSASKLRGKELTLQQMEEGLRVRSKEIQEKEFNLNVDIANMKESQIRIKELALQLKKKNEEVLRDQVLLKERLQKCDECEDELKLWQERLDYTASSLKVREKELAAINLAGFRNSNEESD